MQIIRQVSLLLGFALTTARGQIRPPRVATPAEPIAAMLNAFSDHQIVAIADDHGNEQIHAFRLALLREPRFVNVVNDIVVEFGNARYQEIIDRFVRGDDVSRDTLRQVWENTTQPEFEWDLPIYEEFFRAVRATNASLPPSKRYRVLLGDPPIDWVRVTSRSQLDAWVTQRDSHAAEIIRREVLSKGRRAIVIYGAAHLARSKIVDERDADKKSLIAQLEGG